MDNQMLLSYLENLEETILDENKIVTYKSLSRKFGIHVNTAKQLLYTYMSKKKTENSVPICATYILMGKLVDGSFNVTIVNEEDLQNACKKFIEITSEHIYSVQRGKSLKDINILEGVHKEDENVENPCIVINCSNCVLKSNQGKSKEITNTYQFKGTSAAEKQNVQSDDNIKKKTECPKKSPVKILKESVEKSPKKPSPPSKSKNNSGKTSANSKTSKPTGNISSFFSNTTQEPSVKSNGSGKANASSNVSKNMECISSPVVGNGNAKKDKNKIGVKSERSASKESHKRKKNSSKRKRIQVFSDSEESNSESEEEPRSVEDISEPVVANINFEEENEKINVDIPINKRKKRKIVDKTVMKDGYLETRKEIVFETDSENEASDDKMSTQRSTAEKTKSNFNTKTSQSSNAMKQSSLLNFFKKN